MSGRACFVLAAAVFIGACDAKDATKTPPAAASAAKAEPSKAESHDDHGHDHGGHEHGEHADEVVLTPQAIKNNGIKIATAKPRKLVATILAPARVAYNAEKVAHVGSAVTGRVSQLNVRVGDFVEIGVPLLTIISAELGELQIDYLEKRAAVEIAQPAVDLARETYDRGRQFYEKGQGITLTEVQKLQADFLAAKGSLQSAAAAASAAENRLHLVGMKQDAITQLAKTSEIEPTFSVRAPLRGKVIEREATLGELVGPDQERLVLLADLDPIWVLADVSETNLSQISVGSKAEITVPAIAIDKFEGKVAYIAPELDHSTRTARVRVEVPNEGARLLPGMFATASITIGDATSEAEVIAVPEEAVQTVEGEPAVFVPVPNEPNTFAKRAVGIGQPIGGFVPIYAGLKDGEQYVTVGSFLLKAELGKAGAAHEH